MKDGSAEALLLSRIRHQQVHRLPARDPSVPVPLSFAQQGLWLLDQLEPGRSDYVVPIALRLSGTLDVPALEEALTRLVARHEVLRTRFAADETGHPRQLIDPPGPITVPVSGLPGHDSAALTARVNAAAAAPFDLATGPLLRAALLRTEPDDAVLVICLHHIIFDGWSEAIFARELRDLYAAATGHGTTGQGTTRHGTPGHGTPGHGAAADLPAQYADYAVWQREQLTGDRLEGHLDYWRTRLAGLPSLHLPTDRPRTSQHASGGDAVALTIPAATVTALRSIAGQARASLFMALLTGYQVLLSRYTGQDDIAVGTPVAGRGHTEAENLIGLFVNSLVLRTDLSGDPTFTTLLHRVRDTALGAYDHQDLPFERLVEELAPARDLSRNPLFQTMLVLQTAAETQPWQLAGLTIRPAPVTGGLAKFDLNLTLTEQHDGTLTGHLDYPTDLYDRATIQRITRHYCVLLQRLAAAPDVLLSEVSVLTDAEREQMVVPPP